MRTLCFVLLVLAVISLYFIVPLVKMNTTPIYRQVNRINKRVAITISGQLRQYRIGLESLQKFILPYANCDLFLAVDDQPPPGREEILKTYSPIAVHFGIPRTIDQRLAKICQNPNMARMFYRIHAVNNLKCAYERSNGFTYDFVIRLRPDIILLEPLDFERISSEDVLTLPQLSFIHDSFTGYQDQIAIGPSAIMDIYSNIYHAYIEQSCLSDGYITPERFLRYYLDLNNVRIHRFSLRWRIADFTVDSIGKIPFILKKLYMKQGYMSDITKYAQKNLSWKKQVNGVGAI